MTIATMTMRDLKVGDEAVFDMSYGTEEVYEITEMWVGGVVSRAADGEIIGGPFAPVTSMPWIMLKFGVRAPAGTRNILRFTHEPVSRSGNPPSDV